jgi:hypothetical protein
MDSRWLDNKIWGFAPWRKENAMNKVYVLFQSDGYHPSVKAVYDSKQKAYDECDRLNNDEEAQFRVFNKFYVNSYEVQ